MFRFSWVCLLGLVACDASGGGRRDKDEISDTSGGPTDSETESAWPEGIRFGLVFGDQPVSCGDEIPGVGTSGASVRLQDARFYLHDLKFSGPEGEADFIPEQGPWASGTLVLVDLEDGTGQCSTLGTPETHTFVRGYIPEGDWDTLTFTVGVPFEVNHLLPSHAEPPLDDPSLFVTAQTGHIFLRADVRNSVIGTVQTFSAQITSAGCTSDSPEVAPSASCARPNLARIRVPYEPFRTDLDQLVALDIKELFRHVNVQLDQGGPPGCRSQPDDTFECGPLFATLGMSHASGSCLDDCANQTAFRRVCRDATGAEIFCP